MAELKQYRCIQQFHYIALSDNDPEVLSERPYNRAAPKICDESESRVRSTTKSTQDLAPILTKELIAQQFKKR